ncbi:MAG: SUMF1/EgtB/PvdO family nonheme iron enzyme [Thermodesulfobacteriota bacterium]|nr:SUMF1/EgtB/PvdO family nonheme iron enzyme [Thermodesulfobacteriota bacterium]
MRQDYFFLFTLNQRIQHILLIIAVCISAITGLSLKYSHTPFGYLLYQNIGGRYLAPFIHHIAGSLIILIFLYHLIYLAVIILKRYRSKTKEKRKFTVKNLIKVILSMPLAPKREDLVELKASFLYYLFLNNKRPKVGRFGIIHKFRYWSLFWGIPVMGISGFFLWREEFVTRYIPGNFVNYSMIVHSEEALLACMVDFIWHIYYVHFRTGNFPMSFSWLTGYLDKKEVQQSRWGIYQNSFSHKGDNIPETHQNKSFAKIFITKTYLVFLFLFLFCITYRLTILIAGPIHENKNYKTIDMKDHPVKRVKTVLEVLSPGTKRDKKMHTGFLSSKERLMKAHYHSIDFDIKHDNYSQCIRCHGDLPHGKKEKTRSLLNMHCVYLSCEVCHVVPEKGSPSFQYRWYNKLTGQIVPAPTPGNQTIDTLGMKLAPLYEKKKENTIEYLKKIIEIYEKGNMQIKEKEEILKGIHNIISSTPVSCKDCHSQDAFLPYSEIGYGKERKSYIISGEIVRLINTENEFYFPLFFEPSKGEKKLPPDIFGYDGAKMRLIPEGIFHMGSENGCYDENPVHQVYLKAFYMDEHEVTVSQYAKFLKETGSKPPEYWQPEYDRRDDPVAGITWREAADYASWAKKRLPTEAEWEKAARGGLKMRNYPWGGKIEGKKANFNSFGITPVKSFPPNGYGLFDMAGNVWEWCADWYDRDYYKVSPKDNPQGPIILLRDPVGGNLPGKKVLRGGCWASTKNQIRVSNRYRESPYCKSYQVGFRCVKEP